MVLHAQVDMAQSVVDKKVPAYMAAAMIGTTLGGKDPKDQMKLKLRMHKLKESIIREATIREAQMKDKEEHLAITNALRSLEEAEDLKRARAILRERLGHLERRIEQAKASNEESSSSDEDSDAEDDQDDIEFKCGLLGGKDITSQEYWADVREGDKDWTAPQARKFTEKESLQHQSMLHSSGYLNIANQLDEATCARVLKLIRKLGEAKWPPVFAFMYDEPWSIIRCVWEKVEQLLGGPCVLEPSFTAFHLNHRKSQNQEKYMGNNFALPHRDYTYADSVFSDGTPKKLSVWIPLNRVTTENGCMYVVPREFDGNFDKDGAYEHLQVLTEGGLKGTQFLHFPLNGIKPLPGDAGSLMCWYGNAIHWGSSCHSTGASDPRASLALVFQRSDVVQDLEHPFLDLRAIDEATTRERLKLVTDALCYFKHWYKVPKSLKEELKGALNL